MEFLQHGFIGMGTVVNVLLIVVGALAGRALGGRLSARTAATITDVLGLVVLVIAALSIRPLLQPALNEAVPKGAALVVILLGLVVGSLIGSVLRLEERMDDLGRWVRAKVGAEGDHHFVDGFVTATLVFCVGPLAILGALSDGLGRGSEQLLVKGVLDGFAAVAFASSLGLGVMLSAVAVGLYQGSLTLVGALLGDVLPAAQIDALTVAGGVVLMALSVRLMGLKPMRVADMLPALVCAPLFVWFVQLAS